TAASALDSASNHVSTLSCPTGQQLTGAGGVTDTFNGQTVLDAVFPSLDATGGGFAAFEDDTGNPSAWRIRSYGICANSIKRVTTTAARATLGVSHPTTCPGAFKASGAGADLNGSFGGVTIENMTLPMYSGVDD